MPAMHPKRDANSTMPQHRAPIHRMDMAKLAKWQTRKHKKKPHVRRAHDSAASMKQHRGTYLTMYHLAHFSSPQGGMV